ncbi:MAG: solute carrier 26 family protein [Chloroflexi bacterium]|nr:solute carrier 26 family protein [Chloroflexota bacterium]
MTTLESTESTTRSVQALRPTNGSGVRRYLPFLDWLVHYRRQDLVGDGMAGVIVAIMLVPQGMAYALLAGLPPQVGLYASILPLVIYGLLGSSRVLAVGPVALVSLLTASAISPLAGQSTALYVQLALILALLSGLIQLILGVARLGFIVNFLSHPVISGFTSAAAIVIAVSQLKHLLGISVPRFEHFYQTLYYAAQHMSEINWSTLVIGVGSVVVLIYFKYQLGDQLKNRGIAERWVVPFTKSAPLVVVVAGVLAVLLFGLYESAGVKVVGEVPAGLPPLTIPMFDPELWRSLLPMALTISLVGYMESISVAKSLASKRRQKIDANQELVGLGAANLGAAFSGGYPVTGGISRSVVNFSAGANTGLASIITAGLIALTVLFLTPLIYFLPKAVLAAIIMVAVLGLIDVVTLRHVWHYNKADAASLIITFFAVLLVSVEAGIVIGVIASLLLFLWRTSRPHVAVVGRLGDSETYRNVLRYEVLTCSKVVAIRVDESLYFANTKYLEDTILTAISDHPEVDHLVLIGSAINFIDSSALETLESLVVELRDAGVTLHLSDIKGPVLDRLKKTHFIEHLGAEHIHLSTHDAMIAIGCA